MGLFEKMNPIDILPPIGPQTETIPILMGFHDSLSSE
jgi:hypothetical protein